MPITYTAIASTTVGASGSSNIEFTSIPSKYNDLQIVLSGKQSVGGAALVKMTFNNSTSNYSNRDVLGTGTSVVSDSGAVLGTTSIRIGFLTSTDYTANIFSNISIYIPNYTGNVYKVSNADAVNENNATTAYYGLFAGLWSDTSAITSIKLTPENGSFVQYSTATLYGILKQ